VGDGHHKYDREGHARSNTRPGSEREGKRQACGDGRRGARGLPTCRHNAGRRSREATTAAAATEAQTAAQISAETPAQTPAKANVSTHTCEMVGDSPTPNPESEDTHRPRRVENGRETAHLKGRRECHAQGPSSDFRLEDTRYMADFEEGRKHPFTPKDRSGNRISS